jgi:hypothetical protein
VGNVGLNNLDSFFEELSVILNDSIEQKFFAEDADSLFLVYDTVYKEVERLIPLIPPHSELYAHLDTIGFRNQSEWIYWLLISYYQHGNKVNIDNTEIKIIYINMIGTKGYYESAKDLEKGAEAAKLNDSYFAIGDTVYFSYIFDDNSVPTFMFANGRMQYIESTTHSKLAKFSGKILKKGYADMYANDIDSSNFYYRLRLLTWDNDIVTIDDSGLGEGDTVDFFVVFYGRLFDNYPTLSVP